MRKWLFPFLTTVCPPKNAVKQADVLRKIPVRCSQKSPSLHHSFHLETVMAQNAIARKAAVATLPHSRAKAPVILTGAF